MTVGTSERAGSGARGVGAGFKGHGRLSAGKPMACLWVYGRREGWAGGGSGRNGDRYKGEGTRSEGDLAPRAHAAGDV